MRKHDPISKVMSSRPVTVHHGDPVSKVRKLFQEHRFHHLPVVSGEDLIGMISWTDLMRVTFDEKTFHQDSRAVDAALDHLYRIEDIMEANAQTISVNSSVRDAAEALAKADFHALPVVDGRKLVGIVTTKDLMRFLVDLY
jgi:CBS domain-containing protein